MTQISPDTAVVKTAGKLSSGPVLNVLRQFKKEFLMVGFFSMVANLLMITPTLYMLQVYDRVMISYSGFTLVGISLVALFLFGVMAFSEWLRSRLLVRAGVKFDEAMNSQIFSASFSKSLRKDRWDSPEAFNDLTQLRQFMTGNGIFTFFDMPWTPVYIFVVWLLHPLLGIICCVFVALFGLIALFGHRMTTEVNKDSIEQRRVARMYLENKLKNSEVIDAMGLIRGLRSKWQGLHANDIQSHAHTTDVNERFMAVIKFVQMSQSSLMLAAGAYLVIQGELSPASMVAANVIMGRAVQPVQMAVSMWRMSMMALLSYTRLNDLLKGFESSGEVQPLPQQFEGKVRIEQLVAKVQGREQPILKGINARFGPAEVVVVMGASGSGKSTLARCLIGIWPEIEGTVYLDDAPVHLLDRVDLGPHIGYLPQDVELFEGTVAENIARLGEVDSGKVIAAAKAAGVHEMILRFQKGYDTEMGAGGRFLSGGQRQRIALARAIYGEPRLVVLDEPNANLDDVGEAALMGAVQQLKEKGATIFLITHRQNALASADKILMLHQGEVSIMGPRQMVMEKLVEQAQAAQRKQA
jgi:ATP-binding cassette, subfamily C, bacterial exporter for protease/lipase